MIDDGNNHGVCIAAVADGSAGGHCVTRADWRGHYTWSLTADQFMQALSADEGISSQSYNDGDMYVSGINTFTDIEESRSQTTITYVKAQPLSKEVAGVMSCPDDLGCDTTDWYDARYEKGDTVTMWVITPISGGFGWLGETTAELTEGAVDILTQASAAIALCLLSLNLF